MSVVRYFKPALKQRLIAGVIPPWLAKHNRRTYITACVLSCPPWLDRKELETLRLEALRLGVLFGEPYNLDHIIPVSHPLVCGLTVPWNLQIIPERVNLAKSNKWIPDQGDLFIDSVSAGETYHLF